MPTPARKRKKGRAILFWLVIVALLAGAAYAVKTLYFADKPPVLMTALVKRGDVETTVLATGTLKPIKLVAVGAQVSGRITAVKVALGDEVKQGALIAEIDSTTQQNALSTARAGLANVKAQRVEKEASLKLAEQTLERQRKVIAQAAISRADLESAEAEVATGNAQIAALDAQIAEASVAVSTAEANLGYTRITAPIDGTVLAVVSQEGQTVNANQSTPTIVILGQLATMTVRAEISEADIVKVRPGQPVYFSIVGDPDRRYEATLASIEPAPESIRSDSSITTTTSSSSSSSSSSSAIYYIGIFDVPNGDGRLRTYMTAEVHIVLGSARNVLTIPATALGRKLQDGKYEVRVVGSDGPPERREVEVGLDDKVTAEIRSGLDEGERVVTGEMSAADRAAASSSRNSFRGPPPMGGP